MARFGHPNRADECPLPGEAEVTPHWETAMQFVIHPVDKKDGLRARAKSFHAHRVHLDEARTNGVNVLTAGPLVAEDGEIPPRSVVCSSSMLKIGQPWNLSLAATCTT